jgi:hypothetical protein
MSALAPTGQEAASSEDENILCFLCFRKDLGPPWQHKVPMVLKKKKKERKKACLISTPSFLELEGNKILEFKWEKEILRDLNNNIKSY